MFHVSLFRQETLTFNHAPARLYHRPVDHHGTGAIHSRYHLKFTIMEILYWQIQDLSNKITFFESIEANDIVVKLTAQRQELINQYLKLLS